MTRHTTKTIYWSDRLVTCSRCGARASVRDEVNRRGRVVLRDLVCSDRACGNRQIVTVETMRRDA